MITHLNTRTSAIKGPIAIKSKYIGMSLGISRASKLEVRSAIPVDTIINIAVEIRNKFLFNLCRFTDESQVEFGVATLISRFDTELCRCIMLSCRPYNSSFEKETE